MAAVGETARGLINREERREVLLRLVGLQSRGEDISPVAVDIVRYCLESSSVRERGILALALEILSVQPDHEGWDMTVKIIVELLRGSGNDIIRTVLDRIAQLPPQILRSFVAKGGMETARLAESGYIPIRRAALRVAALAALRLTPLSSPPRKVDAGFTPEIDATLATDSSTLSEAVDKLTTLVITAATDPDDLVAAEALRSLSSFAIQAVTTAKGTSAQDTADRILTFLFTHIKEISSHVTRMDVKSKRKAVAALLNLAAFVFSSESVEESRLAWAVKWMDGPIASILSQNDAELVLTAALGTAHACTSVTTAHRDSLSKAGLRVLPVLIRIAGDATLARSQRGSAAKTAVTLLPIIDTWDPPEKLMLTSIAQLLAHGVTIAPAPDRLRCLTTLAQLLLKRDIIAETSGNAAATKWVMSSGFVRSLLEAGGNNSAYPSEMITELCSACLKTIKYVVGKRPNRLLVMECWFATVIIILQRCFQGLSWTNESPQLQLAKEYLLKLFETAREVQVFIVKHKQQQYPALEALQNEIILLSSVQKNPRIKAAVLLTATRYCSESTITSGDNAKQILKSLWSFLQKSYEDNAKAIAIARKGVLWAPMSPVSTLMTDNAYFADLASRTLVQRIPAASQRATAMMERYIDVLEEAIEIDYLADDVIRSSIQCLDAYFQPNPPKAVEPKLLASFQNAPTPDPLMFLVPFFDGAVIATERIGSRMEQIETAMLEASALQDDGRPSGAPLGARGNIRPGKSKQVVWSDKDLELEVNHGVDLSRRLVLVRVGIRNMRAERVTSMELRATMVSGGLSLAYPISRLYNLPPGSERLRGFTLHPVAGNYEKAVLRISVSFTGAEGEKVGDCDDYVISPYDANFLVPPATATIGLGVWRRRWDLCSSIQRLWVFIRQDQTVDQLVGGLQNSVLTEVYRMRSQTQFSALMCSSTSGAHVTAAVYVPEANRGAGCGPAIATVHVRSVSISLAELLAHDLRGALRVANFRVLSNEEALQSDKTKLNGSYFVFDSPGINIHQRWREAHRARLAT